MSYKNDSDDKRYNLDFVSFPDELDSDDPPLENEEFDSFWKNERDPRADDLLIVNRLDSILSTERKKVSEQIEDSMKNDSPAPLWARVLFHTPKNNFQTLLFNALYIGLMGIAIALFVFAIQTIF